MQKPESIAPIDDSYEFAEPIKTRWTGIARSQLWDYNADGVDDAWGDDHFYRPSIFVRTLNRQKTNVVVRTKREAECLRYELDTYSTDYVWFKASQQRSINNLKEKLDAAMDERGYEPVLEESTGRFATTVFNGYTRGIQRCGVSDDE